MKNFPIWSFVCFCFYFFILLVGGLTQFRKRSIFHTNVICFSRKCHFSANSTLFQKINYDIAENSNKEGGWKIVPVLSLKVLPLSHNLINVIKWLWALKNSEKTLICITTPLHLACWFFAFNYFLHYKNSTCWNQSVWLLQWNNSACYGPIYEAITCLICIFRPLFVHKTTFLALIPPMVRFTIFP